VLLQVATPASQGSVSGETNLVGGEGGGEGEGEGEGGGGTKEKERELSIVCGGRGCRGCVGICYKIRDTERGALTFPRGVGGGSCTHFSVARVVSLGATAVGALVALVRVVFARRPSPLVT
jgi:hypothetical protein